ncbi:MAG: flagellar export chaperone FlgN [Planctomycetota bacterium]
MTSIELMEQLIDDRFELLSELMTLTSGQHSAIQEGHMNELMRVLGRKQRLIQSLVEKSKELTSAREATPASDSVSPSHRARHRRCEEMHADLLRLEANSQTSLEASRDALNEKMTRTEGSRHAVNRYHQAPTPDHQSTGGSLDLTSN